MNLRQNPQNRLISETQSVQTITLESGVEKIFPPYLDWRVDPEDIRFNEQDPAKSLVNNNYTEHDLTDEYGSTIRFRLYATKIGKGGFGSVFLAQNSMTRQWLAIKQFNSDSNDSTQEVEALRVSGNLVFYDKTMNLIGMKLLKGHELYDAIIKEDNDYQHFSLLQRIAIAKNILNKTAGLHKDVKHIKGEREDKIPSAHRDIKADNLILNPTTHTVEFCDYGSVNRLKISDIKLTEEEYDKRPTTGEISDSLMGTALFTAPEIIQNHQNNPTKNNRDIHYDEKTEVYALGMTLAEIFGLVEDAAPITIGNENFFRYKIVANADVPTEISDFISSMVNDDPQKRPTVIESAIFFNSAMAEEGKKTGLKTCVISIDDFLAFTQQNKKKFINTIKREKINIVTLQGSDTTTYKNYYKARYELTKAGIINVSPFMVKGKSQDNIFRAVKNHYDGSFATTHTEVYQYEKKSKNKFYQRHPILTGIAIGLGTIILASIVTAAVVFSGGLAAAIAGAALATGVAITGGALSGTAAAIVGAITIGATLATFGATVGAAIGGIITTTSNPKASCDPVSLVDDHRASSTIPNTYRKLSTHLRSTGTPPQPLINVADPQDEAYKQSSRETKGKQKVTNNNSSVSSTTIHCPGNHFKNKKGSLG